MVRARNSNPRPRVPSAVPHADAMCRASLCRFPLADFLLACCAQVVEAPLPSPQPAPLPPASKPTAKAVRQGRPPKPTPKPSRRCRRGCHSPRFRSRRCCLRVLPPRPCGRPRRRRPRRRRPRRHRCRPRPRLRRRRRRCLNRCRPRLSPLLSLAAALAAAGPSDAPHRGAGMYDNLVFFNTSPRRGACFLARMIQMWLVS